MARNRKEYARRYYLKNRKAILAKTRAYLKTHPEVYRRAHKNRLLKEHDMTQVEYDKRLAKTKKKMCDLSERRYPRFVYRP